AKSSATASLAKQFLGRPLSQGSWLMISHGKMGSRAYSLRQTEVFIGINIFGEDSKKVANVYSNMALIYAE
ncbi:MAG: hypothetical protein MRQ11_06100, partial [Candidatus Midichloria mitochondrii]|nr:hypothetical protein [Candidatus Midichloria mitochondrii]